MNLIAAFQMCIYIYIHAKKPDIPPSSFHVCRVDIFTKSIYLSIYLSMYTYIRAPGIRLGCRVAILSLFPDAPGQSLRLGARSRYNLIPENS